MKRLTASILALGLAASVGTASAQSSGYYPPQYGQPSVDRYAQGSGAFYDYARVVRVDPIVDSQYGRSGYGYPTSDSQQCYSRQDSYAGNDGYYNGNGYSNNGYSNNGYSNSGYGNGGYNTNDGYARSQGSTAGRTVATVIGGVLGAALGSQVGGGSARYATSAIGTMVGGIAGQQVYQNAHRDTRTGSVRVCDPVQVDNRGYNNGNGQYVNRANAYDVTYEYNGRTYTTRTSYNPGNRIRVRVDVTPG